MSPPARTLILMYHRIADTDVDPWGLCVSPDNFSDHLGAIKQAANVMSLTDFARASRSGAVPDRSVVITFDDGYVDNHRYALPLLTTHQVPATLFVTTCHIDSEREFWWDRLETVMLGPERLPPRLELDLPTGRVEWDLGDAAIYSREQRLADTGIITWKASPGSRLALYHATWKAVRSLPPQQREEAIDRLAVWAGLAPNSATGRRTMTSDEIRDMRKDGVVTIGAHTVDHPSLPAYPEADQLWQIEQSRLRLEAITGDRVTTFAYPHGEHSQTTVNVLRDSSFECAVTVQQKVAFPETDPLLLPRFGVRNVPVIEFQEQLESWFRVPLAAGQT